jgi:5S rRNA maturation endonuclease (ribonuclease M5)
LDVDGFAYKRIDGYFGPEENNPVEFPFIVELFLVESSYYEKSLNFFPSINLTPSIYYNSFDDEDRNNKIFTFKTNNNNNEIESSHAITEILHKCGFSFDKKKHRKSVNFVFINLISPRIDYRTGGKINLELKPFGSIAQDLYKFCKSSRIKCRNKENGRGGRTDNKKQELKNLLEERESDIQNIPDLKKIDRWTQSTVFYRLRPILINSGYDNIDRKYITRLIKDVCEELGYKRHELGIIAAERAQLYFDGQVLGVSFDQLEELMKKGTDLLVIEKEGIADVLMGYANSRGIAILNSRGFLTEYATELSDLAEQNGCNIAILTDLDSSGLLISSNLPNAHRIGIDFKTLEKFGLRKEDVEEKVLRQNDSDNHFKNLKKLNREQIPPPYSISDWNQMIKYLEGRRRIEIDSVIARVGSKVFWNFIMKELGSKFPMRNYNRSIDVPESVSPKIVDNFIANIQNKISKLQSEGRQKIKSELKNTEGFLDVNLKKSEIENSLRSIAQEKIDKITQFISYEFKKKFSSNQK